MLLRERKSLTFVKGDNEDTGLGGLDNRGLCHGLRGSCSSQILTLLQSNLLTYGTFRCRRNSAASLAILFLFGDG